MYFAYAKFVCILYVCLSSTMNTTSACNCMRVKDCQPFVHLLLNHKPEQRDAVFALVHKASCGFQGLEPLACCPNANLNQYHRYVHEPYRAPAVRKQAANMRMVRFAPSEEPWIWEKRPLAHFSSLKHNFNEVEKNLHDYWDFKTQRNCPQALDFDFDGEHFASLQHIHYDIEHEDESWFESPVTPRLVAEDRPIVFPGDLRFQATIQKKGELTEKEVVSEEAPNVANPMKPNVLPSNAQMLLNAPNCGIGLGVRLLGGQETAAGQYPWLARIAYRNKTSNRISYRCSGSLISNNYVLTAAHCVVKLVNDLELSHVRIGDDTSNAQDCAPNVANCSNPNLFSISRLIVHPNYDQPRYANDIALLNISNRQRNFTSICLPLNRTATLPDRLIGQMGVAAGWSTTPTESNNGTPIGMNNSSSVRFIRLPIVNTTSCAIAYASLSENFQEPIVITPSHLCAQGQPMNDVCRGDSGGPFMDDGTISKNGRFTLLGIVAFGPTLCGVTTIPGVYTRVSAYLNWILNSMGVSGTGFMRL